MPVARKPDGKGPRPRILLLAGAIAAWAPYACASPHTLDGLMREALSQNRDLAAARADVDAAMGRLQQSGLFPNPRLELSNESDRVVTDGGEFARSIAVAQDFPIAGRIGRAQDVARVDVARALAEVNEAERKLLGRIKASFDDIVVIDQRIGLLDRLITIESSLVTATTSRQKAGEVSELDVNAATLELQRLRQQRIVLTGERAAALKAVAGLAGIPIAAFTIDAALGSPAPLPPLSRLIEQALNRRPDLRLVTLAADRARAERTLAAASAWEDWTASLGLRQDRLVIDGAPPQGTSNAVTLQLTVPLPLFNANQGTRAAAAAEERAARDRAAALRLQIEADVTGKYEQVEHLVDAIRAYREQTLPLSQRNAALARGAYRRGQTSIVEVVQAERLENDLNASYADTLAAYLCTRAALDEATVADAALMTHPVVPTTRAVGGH